MILPAGVIQSIDANGKNPVGGTVQSTEDVWSLDYSQLLQQPIYIAADTLNELRFLATTTTITILAADGTFLWAGYCELDPDPVSWTGVTEIIPPALMTATGSTVVTLAWDGPGTNLVLDNGTTIPESSVLPPTCYYYSTFPATVSNTVVNTTLVPGITAFQIADQIPGSPVRIQGSGTVQWNTLTDYLTWSFIDGSTSLVSFTVVGTDLKVGSVLSPYMWELDLQINYITAQSSTASVQLIGTLTIYDDYVVLPISINTTTVVDTTPINLFHVNVQWSVANANDIFIADYFKVSQNSVTSGTSITPPSTNYDGGQFDSIYGGAIVVNGGTL